MVELTRLNGSAIVVNSDLIKTAEASPDTMLTLVNGEKLIIRESLSVVIERVMEYRVRLLARLHLDAPGRCGLERCLAIANADQAINRGSVEPELTK